MSEARNWQSVRVVIEGLILAALLWTAKVQVTLLTQVAVMQADVTALRAQLADVPTLSTRMSRLEVKVENNERAIERLQGAKP